MSSRIERLCAARDFTQITAVSPHAVKTRDGIVVPRILIVSQFTAIDAEILPDRSVALRPRIEGPGRWTEETEGALRAIEADLGCTIGREPVDCGAGRVQLLRGWGDFVVRISPTARPTTGKGSSAG